MQTYILIEYGLKYFDALGMLWFYSKKEAVSFNSGIVDIDYFESLKYRLNHWEILKQAAMVHRFLRNTATAVSLKCLSNISISFEMPLIN